MHYILTLIDSLETFQAYGNMAYIHGKPFSNLCEKLWIRLLVKQTGSSKYKS